MRFIFLFLFVALLSLGAHARDVRLFENGEQVAGYKELIESLRHAKSFEERVYLYFDDKPPIEVVRFLGHGGLTAVFLRADGRALRVPLSADNGIFHTFANGKVLGHGTYIIPMEEYVSGMKQLVGVEGLIPKLYDEDSYLPQYITVEYFDALFNASDFFHFRLRLIEDGVYTKERVKALEDSFEEFVRRFSIYRKIGDFKSAQIMSDGKTWKLLDLSTGIKLAKSTDDISAFDKHMGPELPPEVWEWIKTIVRDERQSCSRLLGSAI